MELDFLVDNITLNPAELIPQIIKLNKRIYDYEAFKHYFPDYHDIKDPNLRKDKLVMKPTGAVDSNGEPALAMQYEKVNRIAIPLQRLIVSRAASFLTGGKTVLSSDAENDAELQLFEAVKKVWRDNKLQYKNNQIAKHLMSENECCEIWFSRISATGDVEMKMNIYAPSMGYSLIPVWDDSLDLIAFGLLHKAVDGKEHLYLYTATEKHEFSNANEDGWAPVTEPVQHGYGKIPVVYYWQPQSEWYIVQGMIERLETLISNFSDTNDYNGSPILFAKGNIKGFASKGEAGKLIEADGDADLQYVTWEHAPEAIQLEIETLLDFIYTCTQTPNISFQQMKGLGDINGAAWDRIMIDAHLKAKERQDGDFGECIQRRINFLINACAVTNHLEAAAAGLDITPTFGLFKIDDAQDRVNLAMSANGGKPVISQKESIDVAGLSEDAEATFAAITAETDALQTAFNEMP